MRRDAAAVVLVALGLLALRLAITNGFLDYVQGWMRWPVALSGALLLAIGASELAGVWSQRVASATGARHDDADHGHGHSPRVAWLLAAPIVVSLVVAPGALGVDAVDRSLPVAPIPIDELPPLPSPVDGAHELPLAEFVSRSVGPEGQLSGRGVRLVGFMVWRAGDASVARFRISCCAADAQVAEVHLAGAVGAPELGTWVEVEGRWVPSGVTRPTLQVDRLRAIDPPLRPYE